MTDTTTHGATELAPGTPVADWFGLDDLHRDPFPILARLREETPVAFVPAADRFFVTRYADVHTVDNDPDTFTANETPSLMKRSMGHSMLRMDDPDHARLRNSYGSVLKPKAIKTTWLARFEENFEHYLGELLTAGPGADFVSVFAALYAAENLRHVFGLRNATDEDMMRWSQTLINGTGNYADDPEVWAIAARSSAEVDEALDEMLAWHREHPDETLISGLANGGYDDVTLTETRANMKMSIGGGINEPRDALTSILWALLRDRPQLDRVVADGVWRDAFEEGVRWIAPIGMYPRQTTREVELGGTMLPAGARLGVVALSANRDETVWQDAHAYDAFREKKPHLGFGGGVHFCAGAWIARAQVAQVALPKLFERLPDLRLDETQEAVEEGWVFRGMTKLPVTWG